MSLSCGEEGDSQEVLTLDLSEPEKESRYAVRSMGEERVVLPVSIVIHLFNFTVPLIISLTPVILFLFFYFT